MLSIFKKLTKEFDFYKFFFKDKRIKRNFVDICLRIALTSKVLISEISRMNTTDNFKAVAKRNYRFFSREDLPLEKIWKRFIEIESYKVYEDSLIIYDFSDLSKEKNGDCDYNFKFEDICKVWDGSDKRTKDGYVIRCGGVIHRNQFSPLMFKISSFNEKDFTSENQWIIDDFDNIMKASGGRGIFVLDRGFDRFIIINYLEYNGYKFILRVEEKRKYIWGDNNRSFFIEEIQRHIVPYGKGDKPVAGVYYTKVFINGIDTPFTLIINISKSRSKKRGRIKEPLYLLTTKNVCSYSGAREVVKQYIKRWAIENYFQMLKDKYDIENFRVRKIRAIEMLMTIIMLITSIVHDIYIRLEKEDKKKITELIQRFKNKKKPYILISLLKEIGLIIDAQKKIEWFQRKIFNSIFEKISFDTTFG